MKNLFFTTLFLATTFALSAQKSITHKTLQESLNDKYCTGLFKTTDGTVLDVASETSLNGYFNILDWLYGRVAGLQVYTTRSGTKIPVMRGQVSTIYIDEIPVNANFLNALSIHDIAMIKVIKTPFYGGFNGGGGAIAIYTTQPEEDEEE